jgi:alpha-glucuronidase
MSPQRPPFLFSQSNQIFLKEEHAINTDTIDKGKHEKMPQVIDAGTANKSISAAFMKLVSVHHEMDWADFDDVVKFLYVFLHLCCCC